MRKIILMFVILITGIANAQTFDFECGTAEVRTAREAQLAALETKYEVLSSNLLESGNEQEGTSKYVVYTYQLILGTNESYNFGAFDFIEDVTDWDTKLQELEDQLNPPVALTPFEEELKAIYDAAEPPTEFVSGSVIVTEALTKGGVNVNIVTTFFQKLNSENHGVLAIYNIAPVRVTLTNGQFVHSPYQNFTTENHNGGKIREWALDIVQALWHLENPGYNEAIAIAALTIERKAALTALGNVHENVTVELFYSTSNGWFVSINYPNIAQSNTILEPSPRNLDEIGAYDETKYNNFVSAIETVIDIYTDPIDNAAELAALRTTRINELEGLGNGTDVTVSHGSADGSDAFTVDSSDLPFGEHPQTFSTITYGDDKVENLDNRYTDLKNDIIAKVNLLNPLSDVNLEIDTYAFYAREAIDAIGGGSDYGNQLPGNIAAIANAAHASDNNDVIEAFLKKLSKGAIHQGLDSYLEWYQDTNIIVTNNGGVSNGFYDIPITDGVYLGAGNHQLKDLGDSNVRHLAYHIMSNFWHLANQDAATLSTFRLQALVAKANSRGWYVKESVEDNGAHYYEPRVGAFATQITGFGTLPVANYQSGALILGDLSITNWNSYYNEWVRKIDESN